MTQHPVLIDAHGSPKQPELQLTTADFRWSGPSKTAFAREMWGPLTREGLRSHVRVLVTPLPN
jgi:hypothetical protein